MLVHHSINFVWFIFSIRIYLYFIIVFLSTLKLFTCFFYCLSLLFYAFCLYYFNHLKIVRTFFQKNLKWGKIIIYLFFFFRQFTINLNFV